tara:strand:+ start:262 stop:1494 length:1233 start_codon:yes stop_codon:yes gene_type:complete
MQTQQIKDVAGGLASFGRYGDTYMVHAAEGETVIPAEILESNPKLKQDLFRQMQMMGIRDPNRYVVGNTLNSINPITGQPEFFFKKLLKFAKKAAPVVVGYFNPALGAATGAALGATGGGGIKGALGGAASGYFGGHAARGGIGAFKGGGNFMDILKGVGGGVRTGGGNLLTTLGMPNLGARVHSLGGPVSGGSMIGPRTNTTAAQMLGISGSGGQQIAPSATGQPGGGSFLKGIGSFLGGSGGKILGSVASAAIPSYLGYKYAKKFQEEQEDPETIAKRQRAVDKEGQSAKDYFRMSMSERRSPEGQAARREAGITQTLTPQELMRNMGLTQGEAMQYLQNMYPGQQVFAAGGGEIVGPGTGTSDSIPARLSDGEYVMTASAVRGAGNGNRDLGAARMYDLMSRFEGMA